jgi:hypothetical protein
MSVTEAQIQAQIEAYAKNMIQADLGSNLGGFMLGKASSFLEPSNYWFDGNRYGLDLLLLGVLIVQVINYLRDTPKDRTFVRVIVVRASSCPKVIMAEIETLLA